MPFPFPFGVIGTRPDSLWADRVLADLSVMHDAGAIDDAYFRRAWLTIALVSISDDPTLKVPNLQEAIVHWLVQRSGIGENAAPTTDDVFGVVDSADTGSHESVPSDALSFIPSCSIAGRRWKFHKTDKDSNRPAPHGHDRDDHRIVLDPYTGDVRDKDGHELKSAKPKELRKLWSDKDFRQFADGARDTMREHQPWRTDALPPIPDL